MNTIIQRKFVLPVLLVLFCASQVYSQQQPLKNFEGYYQFASDTGRYLQITSEGKNLILHQIWDGKQISFERQSDFSFLNSELSFPLRFSSDKSGAITEVVAFDSDVWNKVKKYTPEKEVRLSADQLKQFEGKYTFQFEKGKDSYLQIIAAADHITLKQEWDGKEFNFVPKSSTEFFCKEDLFPLRFLKDEKGNVVQLQAFNKDIWQKLK